MEVGIDTSVQSQEETTTYSSTCVDPHIYYIPAAGVAETFLHQNLSHKTTQRVTHIYIFSILNPSRSQGYTPITDRERGYLP